MATRSAYRKSPSPTGIGHPGGSRVRDIGADTHLAGWLQAKFFRAVGDPTRIRLLDLLLEHERTGNQCVEAIDLSQGRVSAHLSCLVSCGLITMRREGRFVYYRVQDPRVRQLLGLARTMVADHAASVAECVSVDPPSG